MWRKRKASGAGAGHDVHPFLKGNFAPVTDEYIAHPCVVTGSIPRELLGGQYIRNGGNPVYPPDKGRHYHCGFDGDGMLHGVLFPSSSDPDAPPTYTNRHLATPLLTLTLLLLRSPIPSIALLISPLSSVHRILAAIVQAFFILLRARMGVLSVANTSVVWWGRGLGREARDADARAREVKGEKEGRVHEKEELDSGRAGRPGLGRRRTTRRSVGSGDQRLLATCESGPPLEVRVPSLETVGWDRLPDPSGEHLGLRRGKWEWFKRWGLARVQEDWMTAHPRVDPVDGSLLFYSTQMFDAPHARYSVIDRHGQHLVWKAGIDVGRAKMMHDFGASRRHTILLNLPLTLSPANLFQLPPVPLIHFDRALPSEFVIFPRLHPERIARFVDPEPSLIFHTANAWDEAVGETHAVHILGCRFRSAKLVYAAGAVDVPAREEAMGVNDVVRLWYYRFELPFKLTADPSPSSSPTDDVGVISHMFPLTAIPFEFPSTHPDMGMQAARFVYGCTMRSGSFDERLGGAAKVDCLVKIDVLSLAARGRERGKGKSEVPVDERESKEILLAQERGERGGEVQIFALPDGWYAQEPRFVPKEEQQSEDDGYLLTYVYDERYLMPDGTPSSEDGTGSELWVVDALRMTEGMDAVVCRIKLPQRVPYGLHGTYLPPQQIAAQRPMIEPLPHQMLLQDKLHRSRVQHFVSLLFDRPAERGMSRAERAALAVLWPAAVGMLVLAVLEVGLLLLGGGEAVNARVLGVGLGTESAGKGVRKWWPQISASVAAFAMCFWRSRGGGEPGAGLDDPAEEDGTESEESDQGPVVHSI